MVAQILERSVKHWVITAVIVLIAVPLSGIPPDQRVCSICLFFPEAKNEESNEIRSILIGELTHEMGKSGITIIPEHTWRAILSQEELYSGLLFQIFLGFEVVLISSIA